MCFGFGQGIQGSECTFCSIDFLVASVRDVEKSEVG